MDRDLAITKVNKWRNRLDRANERLERWDAKNLDLPKKPGIYLLENGTVAHLTPEKRWDDGWGNGWEELEEIVGAQRLEPVDG